MRSHVADGILNLIERFGLHSAEIPVDLSPLKEHFVLELADLSAMPTKAFALPPNNAEPTIATPAYVVIHRGLPADLRRLFYAHEIGHVVAGHRGTAQAVASPDMEYQENEFEAWAAAAMLLIPFEEWHDGNEAAAFWEVAAACGTPNWFARQYPKWIETSVGFEPFACYLRSHRAASVAHRAVGNPGAISDHREDALTGAGGAHDVGLHIVGGFA